MNFPLGGGSYPLWRRTFLLLHSWTSFKTKQDEPLHRGLTQRVGGPGKYFARVGEGNLPRFLGGGVGLASSPPVRKALTGNLKPMGTCAEGFSKQTIWGKKGQ